MGEGRKASCLHAVVATVYQEQFHNGLRKSSRSYTIGTLPGDGQRGEIDSQVTLETELD